MANPIVADAQQSSASCFNYIKQNPVVAAVSALAFGVLGIAAFAASALVASVPLSTFLVLFAALSVVTSMGLGGASLYQMVTSRNSPGSPPNIDRNDHAAQAVYHKQIMSETLDQLKAGHYTAPNGTRQPLDLRSAASGASLHLSAGGVSQRPGSEIMRISVKNKDCLYAANELHAKGLKPIVLDMANDNHFGGGYLRGAKAQEEECCRRSGLSLAADTQHGVQTRNFYPLSQQSQSAGLYVPNVPVFRAGYDKGFRHLDQPFNVAFGVIAALYLPSIDSSSGTLRLQPNEANITREKIRTFFEMARLKGHDSVVFGALGCGAFRNPPNHVAEMTMDVINREFKHCFKEIVIAVIDDHNAGLAHNPNGNFVPFARQILNNGGKVFDGNDVEITTV